MRMTEEEYMELMAKRGHQIEKPKKTKYSNNRVRVDGILFDSQLEANYYQDLKLQLKAGLIKGFCRQPEFVLVAGFADRQPITYRADFIVFNLDGTVEIIDTKGYETETFRLKEKLFREKFPGLELKVVK